jgi:hypothetical protein
VKIRILATALVAATTIASPRNTSAQLGGLIKRGKEAAAEKAADAAINRANVKPLDAFGQPLTAAQVEAVLRGLAASRSKLDEAKAAQSEADRLNQLMTKAGQGHEKETESYREQENTISHCQSRFIDARHDSATRAFQQKMTSDPAAMSAQTQAMTEMAARYAKLVQAGDTAGARKLMTEKMQAIYGTPKADTAAAIKKCGAVPVRPAYLADEDNYRKQWEAAEERVRSVEKSAANAGTGASGMSQESYALARERMANWLYEKSGSKQVQRFSDEERKAFEAHGADIRQYASLLQR